MFHAVALSVTLLYLAGFNREFTEMFDDLEYRYTGTVYRDELFRYRLFVPSAATMRNRMPLIVWLHGKGEAGDENLGQLRWLEQTVFEHPWERRRYPFFLLAVQCPLDNAIWTSENNSSRRDDMIEVAKAILDQTIRDYPIDSDRVYLAGISSGGSGCWELAARYPHYFAAVVPMASSGLASGRINNLLDVPVWAFHCKGDPGTPVQGVQSTTIALKAAGGNVHLTELDAASHDCWTPAFADYHLVDWLLTQQRHSASPPPGTLFVNGRLQDFFREWKWWQLLIQASLAIVVLTFLRWGMLEHRKRIAR